ncbi:hypothetical protein BGZ81_006719 [Podila clonocystis]|nr:hypothetical protein BGZ81_006719 [Podila clonocystis]
MPYYSRVRNANGTYTASYWTGNMSTCTQRGAAANTGNGEGQQAHPQNGKAGCGLGRHIHEQRGYIGANAYTGPDLPQEGATYTRNDRGPQTHTQNGIDYCPGGQFNDQRGCKIEAKAYTGSEHTRTLSGRPIYDRILKTSDTNARPLQGPGTYNTNANGPAPKKTAACHKKKRRLQKRARGSPWNRKTRHAQEAKENSTNDAKVDTWLNNFANSLIKLSLNPSQAIPPTGPAPVVSLLDEEAHEVAPTISKQMVLHSARDCQFSGKDFRLQFPNFVWPLSGAEWVERMTEYDTYDPILIRLRDTFKGIPSYKHCSILPFVTPRLNVTIREERYERNKRNWDPNRQPPKWVPEVVYVFGEAWAGKYTFYPSSRSAQEEWQERKAMWKRVDRALNTLQLMKYEGASANEMIDTLDFFMEQEVMANQLEQKLIPKYGYTEEHIARLKW